MNNTLKRVMKIPSFQERYDQLKRDVLENKEVQKFLAENDQVVNMEMVERGLPKLHEYMSQSTTCCGCDHTDQCTNLLNGFIPKLQIIRNSIEIEYTRCQQKIIEDERRESANMISSMFMPKDVLRARIKDLAIDNDSRMDVAEIAAKFIKNVRETGELPAKGLYIYGKFGVGKSFVLGAIANELASLKIRSVVVFVPEFLSEMKQAISDNTLQEKVDFVKKAPVLMLDDLGAETLSAWTRDEILGTILHYRMAEELPTFITSNFDYDGLENHLANSQKGDVEVVKAARIMERIKATTIPIQLEGANRRQ
ncbi:MULTISPECIES: primosomal protein DnaI [Lysinibacillus]|uniref:primosomal protein DnaI n=1 Tax=Lysinibacillus TaxID=400634 RepID=UPI002104F2A7|nr:MULTISPECIES: primosomal protein DnaI [Lysinibacillus]